MLSIVNVKEEQIAVHSHDNDYDNDGHNHSQCFVAKLGVLRWFSNTLDNPENVEEELYAHGDTSHKSTLLRFAWVVVGPMKEEVPHQSWSCNQDEHGDTSQDLDNAPGLVRKLRNKGKDNHE